MKDIDPEFAAHLSSGVTTICHCWKLTRRDGTSQGFTDHDRDLSFDGVSYAAVSGFTAGMIETSLGLNVDNLEAVGALSDLSISEADLASGLYDDAAIVIYRVNWQDTDQRVVMRAGNLGEVTRGAGEFRAELRGLAHRLNQPQGRLFQYGCDTDLGAPRCGVDLSDPDFVGAGSVATPTAPDIRRHFTALSLGGFANGWFSRGRLLWQSGSNAGLAMEVKLHTSSAGIVSLELWRDMPADIAAGDGFTVTAGCDKQFSTCSAKFANAVNFRGFHLMPGNDWVQSYPSQGEGNDGSSLR
ncbi:MAG TPA: beta tubulin [Alphaproteobacteria bacterium]|nr:beta tubulin [Alphaproteobacteria bacterium]